VAISPVFWRYLGFQIPGFCLAAIALILLARWTSLSELAAWVLFAMWVAKDLALYPWARVGYESRPGPTGSEAMLGATGTAVTPLAPDATGRVRVGAEHWRAHLAHGAATLTAGALVRVVEVKGLTLVVEEAEP
jgi:membrane protein implicated in regulation of membrane protease activity